MRRADPRAPAAAALAALAALALLAGCEARPAADGGSSSAECSTGDGAWTFVDVAAERGLRFRHRRGAEARAYRLFETMGGGLALCDFDLDGDLDVFLPQGQPMAADGAFPSAGGHRFFRNQAGVFVDATEEAGLAEVDGYGLGAAVGDIDNDGDPDLLLLRYGANLLLLNDGTGRLQPRPGSGLEGAAEPFHASAAFGDLDGDGWLDLFLAAYVEYDAARPLSCSEAAADGSGRIPVYCGPLRFRGARDRVFLNNRDRSFRDASAFAGLVEPSASAAKSLGVLLCDLDDDADLDVLVVCDTTANLLYRNRGDARFDEVGLERGFGASDAGAYEGGMGIAGGDCDGDGQLDLVVTNFSDEPHRFRRGLGGAFLADATAASGVGLGTRPLVGWGVAFGDLDLDGDLDLAAAHGHVHDNVERWEPRLRSVQPLLLWRHEEEASHPSGGRFHLADAGAGAGAGWARAAFWRGLALGDLDSDGDLDLLALPLDGAPALLENRSRRENRHFLLVDLIGSGRGGRDAVGARVEIEAGGRRWTRWRLGGGSYLSAADSRLHFGLGNAARIDRIEVVWPDGARERLEGSPPATLDTWVTIEKGRGRARQRQR